MAIQTVSGLGAGWLEALGLAKTKAAEQDRAQGGGKAAAMPEALAELLGFTQASQSGRGPQAGRNALGPSITGQPADEDVSRLRQLVERIHGDLHRLGALNGPSTDAEGGTEPTHPGSSVEDGEHVDILL